MRLSQIDFDNEDYALSRIGAQQVFLRTVNEIVPEVLDDLNKESFDLFREAYRVPVEHYHMKELSDEGNELANALWYVIPVIREEIWSDDPKEFALFKKSLWNWSEKWNLNTDWCRIRAFYTIATWLLEPKKRSELDWYYDNPEWMTKCEIEDYEFKWAWHPGRTPRTVIERVMRNLFESRMKEYLDRVEERFFIENSARRALNKKQEEHFAWLVLFHVKNMAYKDIFNRYKEKNNLGTDKAIRKAINETARLIDLPLQQNSRNPGRPRKTSSLN